MTDGPDRAPARAMLKGTGFTDEDLAKPIIGVATTWIETMPCNLNQRALARARQARRARRRRHADGAQHDRGLRRRVDGHRGHARARWSRARSSPTRSSSPPAATRSTAWSCLVGCDKTIPAAVMALARLDIPGLVLYNGSIAPGRYKGRDVTIQDVFEVVGAHAAGKVGPEEVHALESVACPGAGACGGQFTANTMSMALDILGISPAGLNGVPALHPDKEAACRRGRRAGDAAGARRRAPVADHHPRRRSRTPSPASPPAAARPTACCTCSPSPGSWASSSSIDDFDTHRRAHADRRQPHARRQVRRHRPLRGRRRRRSSTRELREARACVHTGDAQRRRAHARRDRRRRARDARPAGRASPSTTPLSPTGGLAILRGNLSPEGCVVKLAGHERRLHAGPARVFESRGGGLRRRQAALHRARRRGRDPLRGPGRRPGHARDAPRDAPRSSARASARRSALITDGRFSGATHGLMVGHVAPEAFRGGPIAAVRDGDTIVHRRGRPRAARGALRRRDRRAPGGLSRRRRRATRAASSPSTPSLVSSASEGAVTRPV